MRHSVIVVITKLSIKGWNSTKEGVVYSVRRRQKSRRLQRGERIALGFRDEQTSIGTRQGRASHHRGRMVGYEEDGQESADLHVTNCLWASVPIKHIRKSLSKSSLAAVAYHVSSCALMTPTHGLQSLRESSEDFLQSRRLQESWWDPKH